MQSDEASSSKGSAGAVADLLQQFDELAEEDQSAFIEALIQREGVQRIMNFVSTHAKAKIEGIRDR